MVAMLSRVPGLSGVMVVPSRAYKVAEGPALKELLLSLFLIKKS